MIASEEQQEYMRSGHMACPGCGEASTMRLVLKVLGEKTIVVIVPSCVGVISATFPNSTFKVPCFHSAFEIAAPTAAGIANALRVQGREDVTALAFAGDGGTFDIGLQSLSGAADRNDNFIYVCLDNEAYMNTGMQTSSLTPMGATTITNPVGKHGGWKTRKKKNMMEIVAAHNIPYAATVNPSYPMDFIKKIEKAKSIKGPSYIHAYSVCPTGWRCQSELGLEIGRLATESVIFPLYEVENGKYTINYKKKTKGVLEYYKQQGRFRHLSEDFIKDIQEIVDKEWAKLLFKEECSHK